MYDKQILERPSKAKEERDKKIEEIFLLISLLSKMKIIEYLE